ncbi:MAG TPA: amidohydrolase family protein [Gemmataceae bacterium]|jgi:cytosine/adenosine deaminase-related metal-dependent hydrolase|nr:amidohydrolase family protein [Gemmataceae bacterium]
MADEFTLTARWVFPVTSTPLEGGLVTVRGDRIAAVEPHGSRKADIDLGTVAIVPGFVNAHTHLDLTGARGKTPPTTDFVGWLRQVIEYRRTRTAEDVRADIGDGIAECTQAGTTLVGDISGDGSSWEPLSRSPLRAVVYRELIGLTENRLLQAKSVCADWRAQHRKTATCRPGLSPHAPYSVHASIILMAAASAMPFCIHLAETADEATLLELHGGPFVEFLKEMGVWNPDGLIPSHDYLLKRTRRAVFPVYAHGNYLRPDAAFLANGSVVYCPHTHAAFGHAPHPFRAFVARGVRVALGTDSLASNPDLSILAEARFVRSRYPAPGDALLRMATLSGAEALGWARETGSLEPGKSADFAVVALPDHDAADPHELLFESELPVVATWFRGREVYRSPEARG